MYSLLPSTEKGYLPYYLLYCGSTALIHSAACYMLPPSSAMALFRGASAPPPTALLAHVYAFKNIYSGLIRLGAAYAVANGGLYDLAMVTFAGVLVLNGLERFAYGTVGRRESVFPFVTAGVGLGWMGMQRGWYIS